MQAALFYADSVSLRATVTATSEDPLLERRLRELTELGIVTTWAHEYEVDSRGIPKSDYGRLLLTSPATRVLSLEEGRQLALDVDRDLDAGRELAYQDQPGVLREGVSELVQLRRSLALLRLTETLDADGVITRSEARSGIAAMIESGTRATAGYQRVVNEIVARCSFEPLIGLPPEAIRRCRAAMPDFRARLTNALREPTAHQQVDTPAELARTILTEYRRLDRDAGVDPVDAAWDVIGAALPSTVLSRLLGKRFSWFRGTKRLRPFVLIGRLSRYQQP